MRGIYSALLAIPRIHTMSGRFRGRGRGGGRSKRDAVHIDVAAPTTLGQNLEVQLTALAALPAPLPDCPWQLDITAREDEAPAVVSTLSTVRLGLVCREQLARSHALTHVLFFFYCVPDGVERIRGRRLVALVRDCKHTGHGVECDSVFSSFTHQGRPGPRESRG